VLQCVAVCCSVLQCVAVCCSVLQKIMHVYTVDVGTSNRLTRCSALQCVAVCCSASQCVAVRCSEYNIWILWVSAPATDWCIAVR